VGLWRDGRKVYAIIGVLIAGLTVLFFAVLVVISFLLRPR